MVAVPQVCLPWPRPEARVSTRWAAAYAAGGHLHRALVDLIRAPYLCTLEHFVIPIDGSGGREIWSAASEAEGGSWLA
jgi:hypothetical protein